LFFRTFLNYLSIDNDYQNHTFKGKRELNSQESQK